VSLYVMAFVLTEAIGAFVSIPAQAVSVGVLLVIALNQASLGYQSRRTAGVVMSVLFTSRLVALTLPLQSTSLVTRSAVVGAAVVIMVALADWVLDNDISSSRHVESFPLKDPVVFRGLTTLLTALLGVPIGFAISALLEIDTPRIGEASLIVISGAVVALWLAAISEELLYRRLVAAMVHHTAGSRTTYISGILFAASYLGTRNVGMVILMFATGAAFAWSCERTGSIRGPVVAHGIALMLAGLVLPN